MPIKVDRGTTKSSNSEVEPQSRHVSREENEHDTRQDSEYIRRGRAALIVAFGITAVNGYVFYQWQLAQSSAQRGDSRRMTYMRENFLCSRKNYNAGRSWTVITAGFSHMEVWHLLANTLGVVSFFPAVAGHLGVVRTLGAYLLCIAGGSAASLRHSGQWQHTPETHTGTLLSAFSAPKLAKPDVPGLGASAGVFGVFTLSVLLAPTAGVSVFFIPLPAWFAWGLLTGIDSYCALNEDGRRKLVQLTGIQMGHEAHLGGIGTALLGSLVLMPRFWFRR